MPTACLRVASARLDLCSLPRGSCEGSQWSLSLRDWWHQLIPEWTPVSEDKVATTFMSSYAPQPDPSQNHTALCCMEPFPPEDRKTDVRWDWRHLICVELQRCLKNPSLALLIGSFPRPGDLERSPLCPLKESGRRAATIILFSCKYCPGNRGSYSLLQHNSSLCVAVLQ